METQTNEPRRLKRLWMPTATLLLCIGGATALIMADSLDAILQFSIVAGLIAFMPLLLILWMLFFSGVSWKRRFAYVFLGIGTTAALLVGTWNFWYVDRAISGSGIPGLRLVWLKPPEVSEASLQFAKNSERIDLKSDKDTDYPQFLGSKGDGIARGVRLERDWATHPPKERWRQSIGLGWSGYAVVGDFAITQEQREEKELVVCYELKTGKARWKHEHDVRLKDKQGGDGPRATPTVVDGRVYTVGGTGILDCIDGADGKNVWTRDTLADIQRDNLMWGKSNSPLVFENKVIVTGGLIKDRERHKTEKEGPSLMAYDKETGKLLWKAGDDAAAYASPVLATLGGQKQILSVNAHSVTGHDPEDGKVLWTYSWPEEWAKVSQPVPLPGDRVLLTAGYGVGCVMLHLKKGSDGSCAVEELWATKKMRTQFSNVLIAHNCAFGLDDRYLACIDLDTGEQKWKGAKYKFGQVLLVGDTIVVQAEDGYVALVEANPDQFKELARFPGLHSMTWNNPVLSGPYLLLRNDKEATCYQVPVRE